MDRASGFQFRQSPGVCVVPVPSMVWILTTRSLFLTQWNQTHGSWPKITLSSIPDTLGMRLARPGSPFHLQNVLFNFYDSWSHIRECSWFDFDFLKWSLYGFRF